ncbi:23S rRNA (guanosine(2251)-2'-O)-methyltransferase RlmB [Synergistales bacterium]|nr:23S rRNA (guanosine(2251)-2'-O)-methyltransferase RlmB [Synergistales bacterium]
MKSNNARKGHTGGARADDRAPGSRPFAKKVASGPKPYIKPWLKDREPRVAREIPDDVCWGRQPVLDIVKTAPGRCTKIIIANNVRPPFLDELTDAARAGKIVYQMTAPEALDSLCGGAHHQGVACRITEVKLLELEPFLKESQKDAPDKPALIVVLDHIEDPQNLGAIVRSAEAAGAAAVVSSRRRSALPGGTVVKTSAGAAMRVPMISVVNIARSIELLKEAGFWAVGLENGSEVSLWDDKMPPRTALVIGSEGEGLSRLVSETCDQLLRIPIRGAVGSLNASAAAALGMFEWRRKQV